MLDLLEQRHVRTSRHVPNVQFNVEWSKARVLPLNLELLTGALHIPCCQVAVPAAQLFAAGVAGKQTEQILQNVLQTGENFALKLAGAIAEECLGFKAFEMLNSRLRGPLTPGCNHLYSHLLRTATPEQLEIAIDRALDGLKSHDAIIAFGAAEMLNGLDPNRLRSRCGQLREEMRRWTELGSWCEQCDVVVKSGSCPKCNVIPSTPRSALIPILTDLGELSVDELVRLTKDPWHEVANAARETLKKLAAKDRVIMAAVLERVCNLEADIQVIETILTLPTQTLRDSSDSLLTLMDCPHANIRARVVLALSGPWIDRDRASQVARKVLSDPSPAVRNGATIALRALTD